MQKDFILIVEDSTFLALMFQELLNKKGYATKIAEKGEDALRIMCDEAPRAVLLDLNLPDIHGMEILQIAREKGVASAIIIITGEASLSTAVEAMQRGADDFIAKPINPARLEVTLANAIEKRKLQKIVSVLQDSDRTHFCGFIGQSMEMQSLYHMIENAARSQASVMIVGESGTGKEVAAQAIHSLSARSGQSFVALNCAAIPHELIESEIFGHVKGAFTGATSDREGAAQRAHGGTLFLDELTEMPAALQSKLLRFIQEGTFSPVGSSQLYKSDIRFISATNRNPFGAIAKGILREDLYYRLAVIPIEIAPLRERGKDIILLAQFFLEKAARVEKKDFARMTPEAEDFLLQYRWPGNVRELENMVRHAVIMNTGQSITAEMLSPASFTPLAQDVPNIHNINTREVILPMRDLERAAIEHALSLCNGNITEAARRLEINPSTIHRKQKMWQSGLIEE